MSRHAFLIYLKTLFNVQRLEQNTNSKFLITSRPDEEIGASLQGLGTCLRLDSGMISNDLARFIDVEVDKLSRPPIASKKEIKLALKKHAGGTFLWASLVLDKISKTMINSKIRERLSALPSSLSKVYDEILEKVESEYEGDAILILQWVVMARRLLTVRELAVARALAPQRWRESTLPSSDVLEELRDGYKCCEPLLYLDGKKKTVNLVHQSAKDYLLSEALQRSRELSHYHIVAPKADLILFESCWKYLTLDECHLRNITNHDKCHPIWKSYIGQFTLKSSSHYLFLQCAAKYLEEHA